MSKPGLGLAARHWICLPILLSATVACAPDRSAAPGRTAEVARTTLDQLFEEVCTEAIASSAYLRMREGAAIDHLDDLSYDAYSAYLQKARGWLATLQSIDPEALDRQDHGAWVDAKALEWDLETAIESERWFWHGSVLTSYSSPLPGVSLLLGTRPLSTAQERTVFLDLLEQVPGFVGQLESRVRGQAERGVFVWRDNFEPSVTLLRSFLSNESGSAFAPRSDRLAALEDGERNELAARANRVIGEKIDPAIESLLSFLEGDYRAQTPDSVGALQLPEGMEYYRFRVRQMTTLDVTPEEVHERGQSLVVEMEDRMAELRQQTGFQGTRDEFRDSLRSDPKYFPKSPEEVADRLMDAAQAMESVVDQYFAARPKAEYGVERLDPSLEGSQTYGFYQPPTPENPIGLYNFNGSKLEERSWLNLRGVSLHELVPGHHFHIARQGENLELPDYRRNTWHGAYTEGWGSYSSYLGLEAGIYEGDPLSEYGMYILEVFLSTRLVVDTGMNYMGWSLEEGREFMRQHTLESETQIRSESLRYAADMPGQALAYQMGKLKFLELREHAEETLGDRFDLRAFHEAILGPGSLPMTVLEEHVDWWIDQQ